MSVSTSAATAGNLMILALSADQSADASAVFPSGFSTVFSNWASHFQNGGWSVATKIMAGGETSFNVSWTGSRYEGHVVALEWSGVDATTPVDVIGTQQEQSFTNSPVVLGITTLVDDAVHLALLVSAGSQTVTPPSGYTNVSSLDASTDWGFHVVYKIIATAGATGDKTLTIGSGSGNTQLTKSLSLKPASGGGGGLSIPVAMAQYRQRWN